MADFRDNWLAHLRAEVDRSIKEHGGVVPGRAAVAQKLEMGEQTLYQILEGKSGKKYPRAEVMALFEKKFGADRPPGWSAQPLESAAPLATPTPDAHQANESQWQLLQDFDMLPDDEKHAIRSTLKAKADNVRKIVAEYLGRKGVTGTVPDERVAESFGAPPAPAPHQGPGGYKKITPVPEAAPGTGKQKAK